MKPYDYVVVGSGLFGATFACMARRQGKKCLVIDKRPHLGGNVYCERKEGINVHKYGAHIFHTSNKQVWDFVNSFVEFNRYTNSPVANYKGELYNLPFNMNTFYQMWHVRTPEEAQAKITEQKAEALQTLEGREPGNLEEQALVLVGKDIYEKLIKGYTEKQWGRSCKDLPAFIIKRLPVRLVFDNNYFNDTYQGIPIGGYNKLVEAMLEGIETKTNVDFFEERTYWESLADRIVFTGQIDEFYDYRFGKVYQCPKTVISKEYSTEWKDGMEPYYPVNDGKNNALYQKYKELVDKEEKVIFGGRLAEYRYYDMGPIIEKVLNLICKI